MSEVLFCHVGAPFLSSVGSWPVPCFQKLSGLSVYLISSGWETFFSCNRKVAEGLNNLLQS